MSEKPGGRDDWTAAAVEEVAPGVHRIPLPLPNDNLRAVNVYAVLDGSGLLLIDSGWAVPDARERLEAALESLDCSIGDIDRFLITHIHRDHFTQAITLRREFGTKVSLGAGERSSLEILQDPDRPPLEPQLHQLLRYGAGRLVEEIVAGMAGHEPPDRSEWEFPDDWLGDGEVVVASGRELTVIETPGHTRGHVVFHDLAGRLLFAGDHVLPAITPSIGFEPLLSLDPLGEFLGALARVRARPDALLLPAHGPVAASVHARVDELVDHHGRRLAEVEAAVGVGGETAFDVAGLLRWTRRERTLDELDHFNQMLAVAETGAHLALLIAQGRVARVLDGEVYRYLPAG
ncbi:MAG TPA: MBL fold metallo-hydrolase [Acidimicrobiales bacterium]|nr:MBL fold metallo-hydrolase [Acidimicrobiales bacterium]